MFSRNPGRGDVALVPVRMVRIENILNSLRGRLDADHGGIMLVPLPD